MHVGERERGIRVHRPGDRYAIEIPLVGQGRRAANRHRKGGRPARHHRLVRGRSDDIHRRIHIQRRHAAGDAAVGIGDDHGVIPRVRRLHVGERNIRAHRPGDRYAIKIPLVGQGRRAGCRHGKVGRPARQQCLAPGRRRDDWSLQAHHKAGRGTAATKDARHQNRPRHRHGHSGIIRPAVAQRATVTVQPDTTIISHPPQLAVRLHEQGVIVPGRHRHHVACHRHRHIGVIRRAVAQLAIDVPAHRL